MAKSLSMPGNDIRAWIRSTLVLLSCGCTPLGLWLYEDPVVTVHRVSLELTGNRAQRSPVTVALLVENRNDYPISAERVELSLRMDGVPIGRLSHYRSVSVAKDTFSTMAIPLQLERDATPERLQALGSGTHVFAVRGRASFRTPIGVRIVRIAHEGSMVFGRRPASSPE